MMAPTTRECALLALPSKALQTQWEDKELNPLSQQVGRSQPACRGPRGRGHWWYLMAFRCAVGQACLDPPQQLQGASLTTRTLSQLSRPSPSPVLVAAVAEAKAEVVEAVCLVAPTQPLADAAASQAKDATRALPSMLKQSSEHSKNK